MIMLKLNWSVFALALIVIVFSNASTTSLANQINPQKTGGLQVAFDEPHKKVFVEDIYPSAKTCAACHPKQYSEWSVSQHSYAQMSPIYMAMQARINTLTSGTNGDFCVRCHNQVGMNMGESIYTSNLDRPASSREGVTCSVCHRVNKSYGKISGRLPLVRGPMHSTIFGPTGNKNVKYVLEDPEKKGFRVVTNPEERGLTMHGKAEKFFELTKPGFCGTCHDVTLLNGFRLEEAFSEFKQSPAAKNGVSCQDCHMGKVAGQAKGYEQGPAAIVDGVPTPSRKITNHFMAGPDYPLIHPGIFPHNTAAADRATLAEWLIFDHEAGWGNEEFEEFADEVGTAIDELKETLSEFKSGIGGQNVPYNTDVIDESVEPLFEALKSEIVTTIHESTKVADLMTELAKNWSGVKQSPINSETFLASIEKLEINLNDLQKSLDLNFPEMWSDAGDREEAREILEHQFKRRKWAKEQRVEILSHGFQLDEINVRKANKDGLNFDVTVRNGTDGHGAPTGFDAERLVFLQVTVTDSAGHIVYVSGDRDPNGDLRDSHSTYVRAGKLPVDEDLFNLQSKFIVRLNRGGERAQVLAVNTSVSALPFIRPEARATVLYGRPLGARKHKKTIEPLGSRKASYRVSKAKIKDGEEYKIQIKLISQMIPVHLIPAIQESGFDYGLSPKELAVRVVEGASTLWTQEKDVLISYESVSTK
jgi:nitrate/TMAO reductase-like tetraheme cytochrome c subunit